MPNRNSEPPTGPAHPKAEWSDEELAARAQSHAQDFDACFEVLHSRYAQKVQRWCRRLCGDPALAEDAAQEVFLKVHTQLASFRGASLFSTWLYVIVRNTTIKALAKRGKQNERSLDDFDRDVPEPTKGLDRDLADRDLQNRLRRAIATELEPDEAKVVVLHCLHGLTLPTITDLMGLENRSGAKALFVAAKRRLSAHFSSESRELDRLTRD